MGQSGQQLCLSYQYPASIGYPSHEFPSRQAVLGVESEHRRHGLERKYEGSIHAKNMLSGIGMRLKHVWQAN